MQKKLSSPGSPPGSSKIAFPPPKAAIAAKMEGVDKDYGYPNKIICGVDEAGRGPIAGPVMAAAVILPAHLPDFAYEIRDSKKLSAPRREKLYAQITDAFCYGLGRAEVKEIDQINILQAALLAMRRAIAALPQKPDLALIDGKQIPAALEIPAQPIIQGDRKSLAIAAASILAKVSRDRHMQSLAAQFPGYGWERNQGYPTAAHILALEQQGITPHHRQSFRPVYEQINIRYLKK